MDCPLYFRSWVSVCKGYEVAAVKIHEFGEYNKRSIVMIHGACMSWDMFMPSINILSRRYHIYAVAVPGHDLTTNEEFTSIEGIAARIELTLVRDGLSRIDLLYGLSVGGGIALRILADDKLAIDRAVIDAGITPREQSGFLSLFIPTKDPVITVIGKKSRSALSAAFPPDRYAVSDIDKMYAVMQHMSGNTLRRLYDTADKYSMPEKFPEIATEIEYWYGEDEKNERKLDISYVKRHIPGIKLREIKGMAHGQYAVSCPEQFADDLSRRMRKNHAK